MRTQVLTTADKSYLLCVCGCATEPFPMTLGYLGRLNPISHLDKARFWLANLRKCVEE